jgi:hypothetical protein
LLWSRVPVPDVHQWLTSLSYTSLLLKGSKWRQEAQWKFLYFNPPLDDKRILGTHLADSEGKGRWEQALRRVNMHSRISAHHEKESAFVVWFFHGIKLEQFFLFKILTPLSRSSSLNYTASWNWKVNMYINLC